MARIISFYSLLKDNIEKSQKADLLMALYLSLVSDFGLFLFLFERELFTTMPHEMRSFIPYYLNINVENRINSVKLLFIASFLLFGLLLIIINYLKEYRELLYKTIGFSSFPFLLWFSSVILTKPDQMNYFWLRFLIGVSWISFAVCFLEKKKWFSEHTSEVVIISIVLSLLLFPAILTCIRYMMTLPFIKDNIIFIRYMMTLPFIKDNMIESIILQPSRLVGLTGKLFLKYFLIPPSVCFLLCILLRKADRIKKTIFQPIQFILLSFYLLLLPSPFQTETGLFYFHTPLRAAILLVIPLITLGIINILGNISKKPAELKISKFVFLAVLICTLFYAQRMPGTNTDFETGHRYPVAWQMIDHGSTFFWDIKMDWGLTDVLQSLAGRLFTGDPSFASTAYGSFIYLALLIITEFLLMRRLISSSTICFFLCAFFGFDIHVMPAILFCLVLFNPTLFNNKSKWVIIWFALSLFFPFFKHPECAGLVISFLPLGSFQMFSLYKNEKSRLMHMIPVMVLMVFLVVVFPFGRHFWGYMRFIFESASLSHLGANYWNLSDELIAKSLIGNMLIVFPLIFFVIIRMVNRNRHSDDNKQCSIVFLLIYVIIYAYFSLNYAYSRTDDVAYWRQLLVLMTVVFSVIPICITLCYEKKTIMISALALLCINIVMNKSFITPPDYLQLLRSYQSVPQAKIINTEMYGLKNMGTGVYDESYLTEKSEMKKAIDLVLDENETLYMMTDNGLDYVLADRRILSEAAITFNFYSQKNEIRSLKKLIDNDVNVSFVSPGRIDFTQSSLYTYYLYRFSVLNKYPWQITPSTVLMMPESYFERKNIEKPSLSESLNILDRQFPLNDFGYLPPVWGRNSSVFLSGVNRIKTLSDFSVQYDYADGGSSQSVILTPDQSIDGSVIGLLAADIKLTEGHEGRFKVSWINDTLPEETNTIYFTAQNGMNIIPLDASPRWLLAKSISRISISYVLPADNDIKRFSDIWNQNQRAYDLDITGKSGLGQAENGEYMTVTNNDPQILFQIPEELRGKDIIIRINAKSAEDTDEVQLFVREKGKPFSEENAITRTIAKGDNVLYFTIDKKFTESGVVRFDPGQYEGAVFVLSDCMGKEYVPEPLFTIEKGELYMHNDIDWLE